LILFDRAILAEAWKAKGYLWFKSFSGSLGGGAEIFFDSTCAKCFYRHSEPRGHPCFKESFDGVIVVSSQSPQRLRSLCERMAHTADSEDLSDFGHFSRSMWGLRPSSHNPYGIIGVQFHVLFENGFPVSYVIFDRIAGGKHVVQHMYTVPYKRHRGLMKLLIDKSLAMISENYYSILHRCPFSDDALAFWRGCGVDLSRQTSDEFWSRFMSQSERS
jgi:hypothetical protein